MKGVIARILRTESVTHDVMRFTVEKPEGYSFQPGQATEVSVNKPDLKKLKSPFTFTCLTDNNYLEFTIKIYHKRKRVTHALSKLQPGDEIILRDVWGTINYKGPGVFIAGGAGVTPFIAIFRQLYKDRMLSGNKLIFSNKTSKDIILKDEFKKLLGDQFIVTLTREKNPRYSSRHIDQKFLREKIKDFSQHFYVCGPDQFVKDITAHLISLGAKPETLIFENS
jgi:ferredoxin-NADP reductase